MKTIVGLAISTALALVACGGGGRNVADVDNRGGSVGGSINIHQEANGSMTLDVDATLAENAGVQSGPATTATVDALDSKCSDQSCKDEVAACRESIAAAGCAIAVH